MADTTSAAQSEREQFEAWMATRLGPAGATHPFLAWQAARRAQPTPPAVAPSSHVLVPVEVANLYDFMHTAFNPMTSQQDQIEISLDLARKACGYRHIAAGAVAPPAVVEPPELSPDFTDTARAALLWVLWHHQGGSSPVGQPIRFALGMGQHDRLNDHQLAEAKRWEKLHPVNPAVWARGPEPLTSAQRRTLLDRLGARAEGMDGETWDQMVIDAVEAHHGITDKQKENDHG